MKNRTGSVIHIINSGATYDFRGVHYLLENRKVDREILVTIPQTGPEAIPHRGIPFRHEIKVNEVSVGVSTRNQWAYIDNFPEYFGDGHTTLVNPDVILAARQLGHPTHHLMAPGTPVHDSSDESIIGYLNFEVP